MSPDELSLLWLIALWVSWQLTRLASNSKRSADALEALRDAALRGRK